MVKLRATSVSWEAPMSATDAPPGCESQVTVCVTLWKVQFTEPVPPARRIVTLGGSNESVEVAVTLPFADGVTTETCCDPVWVVLPDVIDAVIVDTPFATPETVPVAGSTVALVGSLDIHVAAGAPGNVAPLWSLAVAVNVVVAPTFTEGDVGVTATDVNTGVGPVVPPSPLPPHAKIAAAILPAAIVRTTLRNMA
jgi:hypothetical protein